MNRWAFTFAAAALAIAASPASATVTIGIQQDGVNGGAIMTVATGNAKGSAVFNDGYGTFDAIITAFGSPGLPQPTLQTNSIAVSSTVAGMLTIYVTQSDLTAKVPGLSSSFTANSFTGSAISVAASTLYSATNQLFAGTQLASAFFDGIGTKESINGITPSGLYSETTKYVISVGNGSSSVNNTINLSAVPEVATWAMMVIGFGAVGASLRSRRTSVRFA